MKIEIYKSVCDLCKVEVMDSLTEFDLPEKWAKITLTADDISNEDLYRDLCQNCKQDVYKMLKVKKEEMDAKT